MGNAAAKQAQNGGGRPSVGRTVGSLPESPRWSPLPSVFAPQVPVAPLQRPTDAPLVINHNNSSEPFDSPREKGIPTLITWSHGGKDVLVEGSWNNWSSRKALQKSGKDHTILLVLPSGVYHYKLIVDGQFRYIPDVPYTTDERGQVSNILDVHHYVPESLDNVSEFEAPPSPESSYGQPFPGDEDFAKEPPDLPPQLLVTVIGSQDSESSPKPQHVILNHLFVERGCASQALLALGLTHRFQSKYVTVVLYKPLRKY
ncbi:SNF1-related protein kinase regulatory subunit beta-1-like isoform X2 [Typha latifolia]|uniref:SNF1-related protein kinase regulatory subunit beta-1-like isoform X2 n=1 Tax=Typha latifolia TaxID=4733 RepID=UPI003C308C60